MLSSRSFASSRKMSRNSASASFTSAPAPGSRRDVGTSTTPTSAPSSSDVPSRSGDSPASVGAASSPTSSDVVEGEAGTCPVVLDDDEASCSAVARDAEDGREVEDRETSPRRLRTPSTSAPAPGTVGDCTELGDLEHVLDRECVRLAADPQADVHAAHLGPEPLPFVAPSPERASRSEPDELVDAFGGAGALCLLGSELVGGLADLHHRRRDLVRSRLLLLGREDRLLEHRRRRAHQLADLARLPRSLLGRHDRRVRLVLHRADDLPDRLGRAEASARPASAPRPRRPRSRGPPRPRAQPRSRRSTQASSSARRSR